MNIDPDGHWVWLVVNAGFAGYDGYKAYKKTKSWKKAAFAAGKGALGGGKFKLAKKAITGARWGGLSKKAAKKGGRLGKQPKLREMANDMKLPRHIRGSIKSDINAIKRKSKNKNGRARKTIRVPRGYEMAHKRGYEARKGYGYKYTVMQNIRNHRTQHRYDDNGRKR
ncbi:polymorphic toxin type 8 domain-containing protein [Listeria booriae]|uniref:polymorphic toxin type 8 domain-containing protein n=1 Tax=Listeria booriae TaxID=1552123 RepID=UPI00162945DC|nr:polymorphic toxin type 8 domain-containing protein [Listeria booriae]MBC1227608.1 hypothetical protein [Listeria booriae]